MKHEMKEKQLEEIRKKKNLELKKQCPFKPNLASTNNFNTRSSRSIRQTQELSTVRTRVEPGGPTL